MSLITLWVFVGIPALAGMLWYLTRQEEKTKIKGFEVSEPVLTPCKVVNMTQEKYMRPGLDFARGKAIEEIGELGAALGKSIRWGWASENPEIPVYQRESNAVWVKREMKDVRDALDNLEREMEKEL